MYYEDEKNLYHYSYRKGNEHGERTEVHTAPPASDPEPVEPPKKKKSGKLGLIAAALCCALIGGCVGGVLVGGLSSLKRGSTEINMSDRYVAEVERVKVDGRRELTMPEVYEANIGSVVSINVSSKGYNAFGQSVQNASAGSGFIITADGYIVTNYHVVDGANEIKVTLQDGSEYAAAIIGGDEDYDVAVIKVEGEFTPVVVGDSSKLKIGETIAAILEAAPWVQNEGIRLILQPMTRAEDLRRWLLSHGFTILEEHLIIVGRHLYPVLAAEYTAAPVCEDEVAVYGGFFTAEEGRPYRQMMAEHLLRRARGYYHDGDFVTVAQLIDLSELLKRM